MIPLSKIRQMRAEKERKMARAAAVDSSDECTAEDPSKCRVHGIKALADTDEAEKNKKNPCGYKRLTEKEAVSAILDHADSLFCLQNGTVYMDSSVSDAERKDLSEALKFDSRAEVDYSRSVRTFGETLAELNERFPNMKLPKLLSVIIGKPKKRKGVENPVAVTLKAVNESNGKDRYIIMFANSTHKGGATYNHGDARSDYDYVRHELGHVIAMANGFGDDEFWQSGVACLGKQEFLSQMGKVSKCAREDRPSGEAIAECFSLYTSSDYDGRLDNRIEVFIRKHMTGEES